MSIVPFLGKVHEGLSATYEQNATGLFGDNTKLKKMERGYQVNLVTLQMDIVVAQSGGALSAITRAYKLIEKLDVECFGYQVYDSITGDQLAYLHRALNILGAQVFPVASPTAYPGDGSSAAYTVDIPLLFPDLEASLGDKYWSWPSELLRHMEFDLDTAADSQLNASSTVSGTVRVVPYGKARKGGQIWCAPLPYFHHWKNVSSQKEISRADMYLRSLYSVDTGGFASAHGTEKDELRFDDKLFYPKNFTVGQMLQHSELLERIQSQGLLNRNVNTGALVGVTDDVYSEDHILRYIHAKGDLGDSPVGDADEVTIECESTRQIYGWYYHHINEKFLRDTFARSEVKLPAGALQTFTHVPGQFQSITKDGIAMPVTTGRRPSKAD